MDDWQIVFLDSATVGDDIDISGLEEFGTVASYDYTPPEKTVERIGGADIVITNKVKLGEAVFNACPGVKLVALTATGVNNIDLEAARKYSVAVANVAGYSTDSVAQHTFALLLSLLGRIAYHDRYVKSGEYSRSGTFTHLDHPFWELKGRTWGIVGLGAIGRAVGAIAEAFGCRVQFFSTTGASSHDRWSAVDLATLLSTSDIVSVHAPLNELTLGLIGTEELGLLQPHAIILNLARGGIVDEAALAEALDEDRIGGAGFDVFVTEPPPADSPLMNLTRTERALFTPHTAWASVEARTRLVHELCQNIRAWAAGERRNRVE